MTQPNTLLLEEHLDRRLGAVLTAVRARSGMSIEMLSSVSGLPAEELLDHERGLLPIPLARVAVLTLALGVDAQELLRVAIPPIAMCRCC